MLPRENSTVGGKNNLRLLTDRGRYNSGLMRTAIVGLHRKLFWRPLDHGREEARKAVHRGCHSFLA